MTMDRLYNVAVLAADSIVAQMIAAAIESAQCRAITLIDEQDLFTHLAKQHIDLTILATTYPFVADSLIEHKVRHIHLSGSRLFVLMRRYDEYHVMRLLGAGVEQCMTFPINLVRLRNKVYTTLRRYENHTTQW